jgi:hypothetical protein
VAKPERTAPWVVMLPTNFLPVPPSGLDPLELELDPLELDPAPASFEPELEPLDVEPPLDPEPDPEVDPELELLELEPLDGEVPLEPEPDAPELDAVPPALDPEPPREVDAPLESDVDPELVPEPSSGKPGLSDDEPHAAREATTAASKYGRQAFTERPFARCFSRRSFDRNEAAPRAINGTSGHRASFAAAAH